MRVEVTDAALFLYPEFVAKANSLESPGKGFRLTPPSKKPGSTVENIVISKTTAECVVDAIDCAVATLDEDARKILWVKYGWHYEEGRLVTSEPVDTKQTYRILSSMDEGYHWSERKFYDDLDLIRKRVGDYLASLGASVYSAFGMVSTRRKKVRKVTDEEFKQIDEYLKKQKVRFAVISEPNEAKGT